MDGAGGKAPHSVQFVVRQGCGSCVRVREQIAPVVARAGCVLEVIDVADDPELAAEFGDRVPVVLIDQEEFACWEVDNQELAAALA